MCNISVFDEGRGGGDRGGGGGGGRGGQMETLTKIVACFVNDMDRLC
jgi:hypothetical protein